MHFGIIGRYIVEFRGVMISFVSLPEHVLLFVFLLCRLHTELRCGVPGRAGSTETLLSAVRCACQEELCGLVSCWGFLNSM